MLVISEVDCSTCDIDNSKDSIVEASTASLRDGLETFWLDSKIINNQLVKDRYSYYEN